MIYLANDKYSAVLTAGYSVGQSTLYVSTVPDNVPTIVVAAKGTDNETVFKVTGKTTNSLTGVSRLRGANVDLDAQTPLTCLNNEEFMNQYVPLFNLLSNGWQDAEETWTYASATTITVPSGATSKYQKGDKIRLKQGGDFKYFYIIAVADTLLTVTGGSDYTVADAAITDNYYSKASTPQGFPNNFNFLPTEWARVDDGSGGSPTLYVAQFSIQGRCVHVEIFLDTAYIDYVGGSQYIGFSAPQLPKPANNDSRSILGACCLSWWTGRTYNAGNWYYFRLADSLADNTSLNRSGSTFSYTF